MVVEGQRKDYSSSDHAPKGTRMAGDVVHGDFGPGGTAGQKKNKESFSRMYDKSDVDTTNMTLLPDIEQRLENIKKNQ